MNLLYYVVNNCTWLYTVKFCVTASPLVFRAKSLNVLCVKRLQFTYACGKVSNAWSKNATKRKMSAAQSCWKICKCFCWLTRMVILFSALLQGKRNGKIFFYFGLILSVMYNLFCTSISNWSERERERGMWTRPF